LERLDPDQASSNAHNWHSAAQSRGFGTPADPNSVFDPDGPPETTDVLTLEPMVFSPDQDGFDDVLRIYLSLPGPGFVASVRIFDAEGRPVRQVLRNQSVGLKGLLSWDGTSDFGEKLRVGIYLVWVEAFSLQGTRIQQTQRCVLARNFR
jgi:hypothetical protein